MTFNTRLSEEDDDWKAGKRVMSMAGYRYGLSVILNVEHARYATNTETVRFFKVLCKTNCISRLGLELSFTILLTCHWLKSLVTMSS